MKFTNKNKLYYYYYLIFLNFNIYIINIDLFKYNLILKFHSKINKKI